MTWYPDMGTSCMIGKADHVRAIGWLSEKHPFPVGDTCPEFLTRLKDFCRLSGKGLRSLQWAVFAGPHRCELCGNAMGSGNIGVPAGDVLFVAPEMVVHYVDEHRYAPPPEFIAAVLSAPLPGTPEYHDAVATWPPVELELPARKSRKAKPLG